MSHYIRSPLHDLNEEILKNLPTWKEFLNGRLSVWLLALGALMYSVESVLVSILCLVMFLALLCDAPKCMEMLHAWRRGSSYQRMGAILLAREHLGSRKWLEPTPFVVSAVIFFIGLFHSMGLFSIGHHLPHWLP